MILSVASRPRPLFLSLSHPRHRALRPQIPGQTGRRMFSASTAPRLARRPQNFNSGFSTTYDPTEDTTRGPIYRGPPFGVPQFYPRDLKARVDEYVVGQDRAKKTICSAIFNHYQGLRRRSHDLDLDLKAQEKSTRQQWDRRHPEIHREPHPVEG